MCMKNFQSKLKDCRETDLTWSRKLCTNGGFTHCWNLKCMIIKNKVERPQEEIALGARIQAKNCVGKSMHQYLILSLKASLPIPHRTKTMKLKLIPLKALPVAKVAVAARNWRDGGQPKTTLTKFGQRVEIFLSNLVRYKDFLCQWLNQMFLS